MPSPAAAAVATQSSPLRSPWLTLILAWLVPGAGHFFVGRKIRAAIVFACVLIAFVVGSLMHGPLFHPTANGDVLSRLIELAGFVGDLANGLLYFVAVGFGYGPTEQATHVADYGSKFLVAGGLLNILAMVDAYEIASGQKD